MKSLWPALAALALVGACSGEERPPSDDGGNTGGSTTDGGDATAGAAGTAGSAALGGAGGSNGDPSTVCEGVVCPGANQECVDADGSARCQCEQGADCGIVAECAQNPCAADAQCTELDDGFRCDCDEGFSGNGFVCESGDPCFAVVCEGTNRTCRAVGDLGVCQCKVGYTVGSGSDCIDIDECLGGAACDAHATCLNFAGSYRCDCNPGFGTAGNSCLDSDECAANLDGCEATHGVCSDGPSGTYTCSCAASSYGDGVFCKDTDACSGAPCQNGGTCQNSPSGYRCDCPLGTTGDDCADVASCAPTRVVDASLVPNAVLLGALRNAVGAAPSSQLTVADLASVALLSLPFGAGSVDDLSGLECVAGLKELRLPGQTVTDLSPIARLAQLQTLDLTCASVTDLSPLAGAFQLETLLLGRDATCAEAAAVTDLSPLAQLSGLRSLSLRGFGLDDVTPIAGLRRLVVLDLSGNALGSLAALTELKTLARLDVSGSPLASLSPLGDLAMLQTLAINDTGTTSLDELAGNVQLLSLHATGNDISDTEALSALRNLRSLDLSDNDIDDLSQIALLERLTELWLYGNPFTSLDQLVAVPAFGQWGALILGSGQLDCPAENTNIQALSKRGLTVLGGCP